MAKSMNVSIKTKGIVLCQYDAKHGADALFLVYTREMGRILVGARGVKKMSSKLAGHLATFGIVDLNIAGNRDVRQLIGAVLLQQIGHNSEEDERARNFFKEFVARAITKEERDIVFWDLLENFLLKMSLNKKFVQLRLFCYVFAIKALARLGYFSVDLEEKYFPARLNKDFIQDVLSNKNSVGISIAALDELGIGLKKLAGDSFEKEMKAWI